MKKIIRIYLMLVSLVVLVPQDSMGEPCSFFECPSDMPANSSYYMIPNCAEATWACAKTINDTSYKTYSQKNFAYVTSCTKCKGKGTLTPRVSLSNTYYGDKTKVCTYILNSSDQTNIANAVRVCSCPACTNCTSDAWVAFGTGYEKQIFRTCECGECKVSTKYRCAAGYYGTSINGASGCSKCPDNGTSNAGATLKTGCYLPSGTNINDTVGQYTLTENCSYKN